MVLRVSQVCDTYVNDDKNERKMRLNLPPFYLVRCVDFFITVKKCRQEATIYERRRASTSIISRA